MSEGRTVCTYTVTLGAGGKSAMECISRHLSLTGSAVHVSSVRGHGGASSRYSSSVLLLPGDMCAADQISDKCPEIHY